MRHHQRGGFAVGFLAGLVLGVVVSLGVALYVTKVPVPFVNKVQQRTAEQEAAEMERNRNWDPNSPLYGRNPARPASAPAAGTGALPPGIAAAPAAPSARTPAGAVTSPVAPGGTAPAAPATRNPADILADRPIAAVPPPANPPPLSTRTAPDPFSYFVQAGAYNRGEDAEQQRARLAMLGFTARVTEREQAGRTVYRVRLGPFDRRDDAEAARQKLGTSGVESALVPVQK